jgi:hypothetical protein
MDFKIYVIGVDQPLVAFMARYPKNPCSNLNEKDCGHDVGYTSSIF